MEGNGGSREFIGEGVANGSLMEAPAEIGIGGVTQLEDEIDGWMLKL